MEGRIQQLLVAVKEDRVVKVPPHLARLAAEGDSSMLRKVRKAEAEIDKLTPDDDSNASVSSMVIDNSSSATATTTTTNGGGGDGGGSGEKLLTPADQQRLSLLFS